MRLCLVLCEDIDKIWSIHICGPDASPVRSEINVPESEIESEMARMSVLATRLIPVLRRNWDGGVFADSDDDD